MSLEEDFIHQQRLNEIARYVSSRNAADAYLSQLDALYGATELISEDPNNMLAQVIIDSVPENLRSLLEFILSTTTGLPS